jgi:CheY-like chemotaxis protein
MSALDVEVLLAEDNPADAELILFALRDADITGNIHHVYDGEEAMDFILCQGVYAGRSRYVPLKLIVLDVKLPKMDGMEVLREIKRHAHSQAIPVVLLTSSKEQRDVVQGYRLGANSYVQKPMDFSRFRETVRRLGLYWLQVNEPPPAEVIGEEDG